MSSINYAKQGNNCHTHSVALTSNEKFLNIDDPIYARILTKHVGIPGCVNCTNFSSKQIGLKDDGDIKGGGQRAQQPPPAQHCCSSDGPESG